MNEQKNSLFIPGAIILAGFVIAGGIYLSNKGNAPVINTEKVTTNDALVKPVSKDDHILGNPNASIVVVEYGDTECPPCKMFHFVMNKVIDNYGKSGQVAWVFRHSPIEQLHSKAPKEAEAVECAASLGGEDIFWKYIDKVYEITPGGNNLDEAELPKIATSLGLDLQKFNICLSSGAQKSRVDADLADAIKVTGGNLGTPHLELILKNKLTDEKMINIAKVFGNNLDIKSDQKHISSSGAYPYEAFKSLIDIILK